MHIKGASHFSNATPFVQQTSDELPLIRVQLWRSAELDATSHRSISAGGCSLTNEVSLELRDACEHRHNHLACMRRCVCPWFRQRLEPGAGIADGFHSFEKITSRSGKPVQFPDDKDVAFAQLVEHALKLRANAR